MNLNDSLAISASGMRAQGTRLRVIAENIANTESLGARPGDDPYRRKTITFENVMNRQIDADIVRVAEIGRDLSDFGLHYDPGHPLADDNGYVKKPNVNVMIEMQDMTEAQRSYEANMSVIESARSMLQRTVDLIRS